MWLYVAVAALAVLGALAVFVASQPSNFRIARSTTINTPATDVFGLINDLHQWEGWSPWAKLDPGMKQTYSGPPAGVGTSYAWSGNNKVGEGRMTIEESRENERVRIKLEFLRPFAATNQSEFVLMAQGAGATLVTWSMTGQNNFMAKAFNLVMNMDKLVGADFERGLASLKSLAEQK